MKELMNSEEEGEEEGKQKLVIGALVPANRHLQTNLRNEQRNILLRNEKERENGHFMASSAGVVP
ncbi:hypothetical protein OUZ56_014865 [Daphnia magna]|uniref:Uncharacterized protein n=1 Tax=Daphnia magna TaxID=35525 RepID=A0ABR0AL35_9CRUS|nr:hypothetical protein OUZ56_014865 [Daphnia magna]